MRRSLRAFAATALLVFTSLLTGFSFVHAATPSDLAQTYAPSLQFTTGEKFFPTSVDYVISSSTLMQRASDGTSTVVSASPTASSLGGFNSATMFLNNKLQTFDAIAADYAAKAQSLGYYTYVHVLSQGGSTVIQYWLFYAYNNGPLNDHQSDWEVVEIFVDSSGNPTQALYSQHLAGESVAWRDVQTSNGHPVVFVAQGSHANYFRPYQGKIGIENDVVDSGGLTITPDKLNLVILQDESSRPASQSWLNFPGRWGYVGTDTEVATGMAGPLGPVYNDGGQRWSSPSGYLSRTFAVDTNYFYLAWFAANFVLVFLLYVVVRGIWKSVGIVRLSRKGGGLRTKRFLRSRGGAGLVVGLLGVAVAIAALFLPWYSVSASAQGGPLSGVKPVQLMSIDGIDGLTVNLFTGPNADSTSGLTTFASTHIPFAIIVAAGLVLLFLDIIGVKSGRSLGRKFITGSIVLLLPLIIIYVFVSDLPNLVPLAASLLPGGTVPPEATQIVNTMAANPIGGTTSQTFPVVGTTTVVWGIGLGIYLFIAAVVLRIIGGAIIATTGDLSQKKVEGQPAVTTAAPAASA